MSRVDLSAVSWLFEKSCGCAFREIADQARGLKRTRRGVDCGDLLRLASRLLEAGRENCLCSLALLVYLERIPLLVDCSLSRGARSEGIVATLSSTRPSSSRLASLMIECLMEDVNTINLVREAGVCHPLEAQAYMMSFSKSARKRAAGRVQALLDECRDVCVETKGEIEGVADRLASASEKALKALRDDIVVVLRDLCRDGLREVNKLFCEIIEER